MEPLPELGGQKWRLWGEENWGGGVWGRTVLGSRQERSPVLGVGGEKGGRATRAG